MLMKLRFYKDITQFNFNKPESCSDLVKEEGIFLIQ